MKFTIVKKGYDKAEVDQHLASKERASKDSIQDKMLRIDELKGDVARRDVELVELRTRADSINVALLVAVEKAKDMELQAKLRYTLELERLKLFRIKWQTHGERAIAGGDTQADSLTAKLDELEAELMVMAADKFNCRGRSADKGISSPNAMRIADNAAEDSFIEESKRLLARLKHGQCNNNFSALATSCSSSKIQCYDNNAAVGASNKYSNDTEFNLDDLNGQHDIGSLLEGL